MPQLCKGQGFNSILGSKSRAVTHFPFCSPTPLIPATHRTNICILVHLIRNCQVSRAFSILVWSSSVMGKQSPHHPQYWALVQPEGSSAVPLDPFQTKLQLQDSCSPSCSRQEWRSKGVPFKLPGTWQGENTPEHLRQNTQMTIYIKRPWHQVLLFPSAHEPHQIGPY